MQKLDKIFFVRKWLNKDKNYDKKYFGMISKFIIDLCRCFYLIDNNFDVLYLKYCSNEITPENNVILALNSTKNI
jgi:hypothetical protein